MTRRLLRSFSYILSRSEANCEESIAETLGEQGTQIAAGGAPEGSGKWIHIRSSISPVTSLVKNSRPSQMVVPFVGQLLVDRSADIGEDA